MNALSPVPRIGWVEVGHPDEVPARGARRVATEIGDVALFRTTGGELFALRDRCPHKGGPLSQGIVHGRAVACPLHNWTIDLVTGEAAGADAGKGCAPSVPLEIRDGRIFLGIARR